jgi:hypothetical protein
LSDLATPLRIKLSCAGRAALDATLSSPLDSLLVSVIYLPILNLAGREIDDQLPELDRVAWAFEASRCHARNMACSPTSANPT